jgi:hypothetical protein
METKVRRSGGARRCSATWRAACSLALLLSMAGLTRAQAPGMTAKEVAAKNVEAMGGAAQFQAVQSIKVTGKLRFPDGKVWGFTVRHMGSNQMRIDLDVSGQAITQAFDGTTGWQVSPGTAPQALDGDELKSLIDQAANAVGSPLVDYEARGNTVELLPEDAVDGKPCYVLKVTLKTGNTMTMYFDKKTFLEVREVLPRTNDGKDATIVETVSDFKKFGALYLPSLYVSGPRENPQETALVIEGMEFNPPMDAAIFRMPAAPAPPVTAPAPASAPAPATPPGQ